MSTFKFRLATIERLREALRNQRRSELADALRVDEELQRQQTELAQSIADTRTAQRVRGKVDVDRLLDWQRYEQILYAQQRGLAEQRASVQKELELRRQALVEADRDVKVLEKLRNSQHARWRVDQQRADQKRLDEVAVLAHWRREQER